MQASDWYLIAYDITDPRRLRRVHQALRGEGVPMQQSVFLVQRDRRGITSLMNDLADLMHRHEDDLRAYPIPDPGAIWLRGKGILAGAVLAPGAQHQPKAEPPPKRGWWRRLVGGGEQAPTDVAGRGRARKTSTKAA